MKNLFDARFNTFLESICNVSGHTDILPALQEGFKAYCESTSYSLDWEQDGNKKTAPLGRNNFAKFLSTCKGDGLGTPKLNKKMEPSGLTPVVKYDDSKPIVSGKHPCNGECNPSTIRYAKKMALDKYGLDLNETDVDITNTWGNYIGTAPGLIGKSIDASFAEGPDGKSEKFAALAKDLSPLGFGYQTRSHGENYADLETYHEFYYRDAAKRED